MDIEECLEDMEIKKTEDHKEDCLAVRAVEKGNWDTPWSRLTEAVFLTEDGEELKEVEKTIWTKIPCNDTECPAEIIVKGNPLIRLIQAIKENEDDSN